MKYAGSRGASVNAEHIICRMLAHQCMPTLLKVKPASLLLIDKSLVPDLREFYLLLMKYLKYYSCSCVPFQETNARLYLFLYSEELLYQTVTIGMRQSFLERYGYSVHKEQIASVLELLGRKYRNYWISGEFPHEIGILLGYPLIDVEGFIRNHGRNYLLCGMWKVYGRVKVAEAAFLSFHQLRSRAVSLAEKENELPTLSREEGSQYNRVLWELLTY